VTIALLVSRVLLAAVFAAAAGGKLADLEGARRSLQQFGLPAQAARAGSVALPLAELAVALTLLARATAWWGAVAAVGLLTVFCAVIARSLVRGEAPECNCFGSLGSAPVGSRTLARNAALLVLAGFVIVAGREGVGASVFSWAGALTAALLAQAVFSWQLFKQNGRLLARVASLEEGSGYPARGLAVGEPAPAFALPDLDGRLVGLEDLLARGSGALLVFADPGCAHCTPLLPAIAAAQAGGVEMPVAVISTGEVEANRPNAQKHGIGQILLQEGFVVAERYHVYGAPAAVLLDENGLVTGQRAEGARAVRELLAALSPARLARVPDRRLNGYPEVSTR
jgi:methylamine dehydrogenase accessory protein MauD